MKIKHFLLIAVMLICGLVNAQEHHYQYNGGFEDNLTFWAKVQIDGVEQQSNDVIEIGAFNGTTVTDSKFVKLYNNRYYLVCLTIGGNNDSPYNITFKLYNHNNSEEILDYILTDNTGNPVSVLPWEAGLAYGKPTKPYVLNFRHTFSLPISAYTTYGNWYMISSPLATSVDPTAVENMIPASGGYDLFYFDQTQTNEWVTYKSSGEIDPGFTNIGGIVPGRGYLYANSANVELTFVGAAYTGNGQVEITNAGTNYRSAGWNMIGNPFPTDAEVTKSGVNVAYYVMNGAGEDFVPGSGDVGAMHGIMVYAENATETVTFTPANSSKGEDDSQIIALNLSRGNGDIIDRVMVRMDECSTLPKYVLNPNNAHMSAVVDGEEYAVVNGTNASIIPVNFKADMLREFTLSVDIQGVEMDYLHLIDRLSGEDIDMLLENSYTFVGAPDDMTDRFVLSMRATGFDSVDEVFAYQNGSDIIVNGNGTLEVFDVMGRFISSHEINGVQNIQAMPMGVYVFRMVGDNIKTQKIVVR